MAYETLTQTVGDQLFDGHAVNEKVVVPGAYYLQQAFGNTTGAAQTLEQIEFLLPLFQSELDATVAVQLVHDPAARQQQVTYKQQVVASYRQGAPAEALAAVSHWQLTPGKHTTAQAYAALWQLGNQFSGHYKLLTDMRQDGSHSQFELAGHKLQPLHILDACLHSVLLASAEQTSTAQVLMRIEKCQLAGNLATNLQVQVELLQQSASLIKADVRAIDTAGQVVFLAKGVQFCPLSQGARRTALVQGNFTLAPLEEISAYLGAAFNSPYEVEVESYLDWRHALARPVADTAAYDSRVLVVRPQDLIKPQPLALAAGMDTSYLPNGMQLAQVNQYETDYLYREIFVDRCYGRHGIIIEDNDVVIDVGANIGMFSLYALQQAQDVKVYAFEPSPRVADCLRANTAARGDVTVMCAGVAEHSGEAIFSFYPKTSVFSSFFSAADDDLKTLREVITNQVRKMTQSDDPALLHDLTESMLQDRLQQEDIACPLINLSEFMRTHAINTVGLLKIDAEKAELGILRSLSAEDFSRVRQICLEVHDPVGDKLEEALAILACHGFNVEYEEETALSNTGLYTVTAKRHQAVAAKPLNYEHYGMQLDIEGLWQALLQYNRQSRQQLHLVLAPSADPSYHSITTAIQAELPGWLNQLPTVQLLAVADQAVSTAALFSEALPDEADIPYSALWYGLLGRGVFHQLLCIDKTPHKLIVVDADNTLWGGVVAEQGTQGITLSAAYLNFQKFLLEQYQKGVMLALCSKNIASDVMQVFQDRPEMLLKPEHFIAISANWQAKSANIYQLTSQLSIGLDAVIFIDDNPAELAEVTGTLPQVLVLQFTEQEQQLATMMNHWAFTTGKATEEDLQRSKLYLANQQRDAELQQCQSYEAFLTSLQLELEIGLLQEPQLARVAQLTERTNQFNATKQLITEQGLAAMLVDPARQCLTLQVKDKYGDYGLVGAALCTLKAEQLVLDNMLLSCRALGKGIEHRFLAAVAQWGLGHGKSSVVLQWRELPRNLPLRNFYTKLADKVSKCDGLFQAEINTTELSQLTYSPEPSQAVSAVNSAASAGLSLKYIDNCFAKVADITKLVRQVWPEHDVTAMQLADADALELKIAKIWFKVLGKPVDGLDHDFFNQGGNSLRLVRVLGIIYSEFGVRLSLSDAFEHKRTVRQQAAFIRAKIAFAETDDSVDAAPSAPVSRQLSENQLGIYFSQLLNPATSAYNVPLCLEITKSVSVADITAAALELGNRQPILRRGYRQQGRQTDIVELEHWLDIQYTKLPPLDDTSRTEQLKKLADQPIKLTGPVVKLHILETEQSYTLLFVLHHLYCDLASMEIFFDSFLSVLNGIPHTTATTTTLSAVNEDFSVAAKSFWSQQLQAVKPLALPVTVNNAHQQLRGDGLTLLLDQAQSKALEQLIHASGASSFVYLFGCYYRYLQYVTQDKDFAVGVPVCLRDATQHNQIGNFVNLLPIRVSATSQQESWVKATEKALLNALEFKAYPYRRMVKDSAVKTDTGRAALTQTTFAYHEPLLVPAASAWFGEGCTNRLNWHGQPVTLHGQIQQCGQTDIAVEMLRCNDRFGINVKFDSHLLSAEYAYTFLQGFINFIFK